MIVPFGILLSVVIYFLHIRVEKLSNVINKVYSNIDNLYDNQKELTNRILILTHEYRKKNKK